MAMANDMSKLLRKISRRLGMTPVLDALPDAYKIDEWANVIMEDTIVEFSRAFPYEFRCNINSETTYKKKINGVVWYYIKDEILCGNKLIGIRDIDWMDLSTNNTALGSRSLGGGYYYPEFGCPEATLESILALQMNANFTSLYNRGIYIDFKDPNRFALRGIANTNYDLNSFVVVLLIEHSSLATISASKMTIFEELAQADIANYLFEGLKYWDGLPALFVDVDLKLQRLENEAGKRDGIMEKLDEARVSASNEEQPLIWTV